MSKTSLPDRWSRESKDSIESIKDNLKPFEREAMEKPGQPIKKIKDKAPHRFWGGGIPT